MVTDGTNASDRPDDRPGMRAMGELGVLSPLRICGISKRRVRELSSEAGLFTAEKPSYACLATRIPTGVAITRGALECVERAEDALRALGFSDLRVRLAGDSARLELPEGQLALAVELRGEILSALKPMFGHVVLDLDGRKNTD